MELTPGFGMITEVCPDYIWKKKKAISNLGNFKVFPRYLIGFYGDSNKNVH